MQNEGPELEALLHRLSECPSEFLQASPGKTISAVEAVAIVCDHMRRMTPSEPPELHVRALELIRESQPSRLALVSVVCWLLHDEWFLASPRLAPGMWRLLAAQEPGPLGAFTTDTTAPGMWRLPESDALTRLATLIRPEKFVSDPDRREELVRVCLAALELRPRGETAVQAADRLVSLDSFERDRVLRATAAAEKRAREVREAMARAEAQEAASRYGE